MWTTFDMPGDIAYPRFMIAVNRKFITMPSSKDGQHGIAVF